MTRTATRRASWVFVAAAAAYLLAIVHRTAFGVAGVAALDRFGVGATGLAALSIAQIAMYAALQPPAGRLLDRFGPRAMLVTGSLLMAAGQAWLAFSDDVPTAIAARLLIGAGDAPIFITASRLVAQWFPPRRAPMMVQLTAQIGQVGQLASAIPVAWLLHAQGWSPTFLTLAGVGAVAAIAAGTVRSPRAEDLETPDAAPASRFRAGTVSRSGVWLGFWTHFTALFSANTLALLWGVPFFVSGQGRSTAEASLLLTVLTLAKFAVSPFVGTATARHPLRRSWIVLAFSGVAAVAWAVILIPSTPRPLWELIVFAAVIGMGGPVSLVGLDFARTFAEPRKLGAANGIVNTGGFVSTIAAVGLVGLVLEWAAPGGTYDLDAYRLAFVSLVVPWIVGIIGIVVTRRAARRDWAADGVVVAPWREALAARRRAQRPEAD